MRRYCCTECTLKFDSFQQKANHVRWQHKDQKFSADGYASLQEKSKIYNEKRYGKLITQDINCFKCNKEFNVSFREGKKKERYFCSRSCANSRTWDEKMKNKISIGVKKACKNPIIKAKFISNLQNVKKRNSSKAERKLASMLKNYGFTRHLLMTTKNNFLFDIDIVSKEKDIWIESDGSWHFKKVHAGHDFEKTKLRDTIEEYEAINRNVLLIRVNNEKYSIDEQINFIFSEIRNWDKTVGKVTKLY